LKEVCIYFLGYITYYAFMSTFFWLNAICFDFSWKFWYVFQHQMYIYIYMMKLLFSSFSRKINAGRSEKKYDQKMFWRYSLYSWTSPLLMTLGVLMNQFFYTPKDSFKVEIGETVCFLNTNYEEKCECQK
jgi:hypothetical protein